MFIALAFIGLFGFAEASVCSFTSCTECLDHVPEDGESFCGYSDNGCELASTMSFDATGTVWMSSNCPATPAAPVCECAGVGHTSGGISGWGAECLSNGYEFWCYVEQGKCADEYASTNEEILAMGNIMVSNDACQSKMEAKDTAICYDYCQLDNLLGAGVCAGLGTSLTDRPTLCGRTTECFTIEVTGGYFGASTVSLSSCHNPGASCEGYAFQAQHGFGGATISSCDITPTLPDRCNRFHNACICGNHKGELDDEGCGWDSETNKCVTGKVTTCAQLSEAGCDNYEAPCSCSTMEKTTDELCPAVVDQDCKGSWSKCSVFCEKAGQRTWTERKAQSGNGAACPAATDCQDNEDKCRGVCWEETSSDTRICKSKDSGSESLGYFFSAQRCAEKCADDGLQCQHIQFMKTKPSAKRGKCTRFPNECKLINPRKPKDVKVYSQVAC